VRFRRKGENPKLTIPMLVILKKINHSNLIKEKLKLKLESEKVTGMFLLLKISRMVRPRTKKPKRMTKMC